MSRINEILSESWDRLGAAKCGLAMIGSAQGEGRIGIRNVAIFGRMVTFATNNFRSQVDGFLEWDANAKARHFQSEDCRYMYGLRNEIEKQARTPAATASHIRSFSPAEIGRFERPPGATGFFIGDRNGGSGWTIRDPDGNETKFYIELPSDIGWVKMILPEYSEKDAYLVSKNYVNALEAYLSEVDQFVRDSAK